MAYTNTNFARLKTESNHLFIAKVFEQYIYKPFNLCFNNLLKKFKKGPPKKCSSLAEFPPYLNYASYYQGGADHKEANDIPWEVASWKDLRGILTINHEKLGILCF
jgi:hypothetical protein